MVNAGKGIPVIPATQIKRNEKCGWQGFREVNKWIVTWSSWHAAGHLDHRVSLQIQWLAVSSIADGTRQLKEAAKEIHGKAKR